VSQDKEGAFLRMAVILSSLATCDRAHVGCIIVKDGRCISWGYNGAPPGLPHCDVSRHGWYDHVPQTVVGDDEEKWIEVQLHVHGCRNTTHAEANALAFAARQGISTDGAQMFTTVSPCEVCSKAIIAAGITDVHYLTEYRDPAGIELLDKAKVYTHHHGY